MGVTGIRIKEETSNAAGTAGDFDLDGAVFGHRGFVEGVGDGVEVYYLVEDFDDEEDPTTGDWEAGKGTITAGTPSTISRDTVIGSSNAGSAVNWGAGVKRIKSPFPPGPYAEGSNNLSELTDATAARSNLGLGTASTHDEGSGNGLDADKVDGLEASAFWEKAVAATLTAAYTFTGALAFDGVNTFSGENDFNSGSGRVVFPVGADRWAT